MSPTIRPVPTMLPSRRAPCVSGDGGTISAIGFPKRVMRIGFRVLRTCFSKRKQLALNSEIGISLMLHLVNETYQSCATIKTKISFRIFPPTRPNHTAATSEKPPQHGVAGHHTPITPHNSFTAAALLSSPAFSSAVSLISMICSIPFAPSFTGTPTYRPLIPYSPCK